MKGIQILKLIVSLAIPLALGAIAGMFTADAVPEWYESLNKPSFSPPNWIFGPAWTLLYILLGISFFLIWKTQAGPKRSLAMWVYALQLLLNFAWSFIFFYFHYIGLALIEIAILWILIFLMMITFYRIKTLAAYINIPYLLWVTFAGILNAAYYFLN